MNLLKQLKAYKPYDELEKTNVKQTIEFLQQNKNAFKRENLSGHITASCYLFNADYSKVLLTLHKKLNDWYQLGGHCDGNKNTLFVALKEGWEESGIKGIKPISKNIADVDIQDIPYYAPKDVPAHKHYDIRYFFTTKNENFVMSDESNDLKWHTLEEFAEVSKNFPDVGRVVAKWKNILNK